MSILHDVVMFNEVAAASPAVIHILYCTLCVSYIYEDSSYHSCSRLVVVEQILRLI